ncbi:hypothetical protein ACIGXG_31895 [Streptomyces goshikiensis]|uniref:hypothetical protein n=1 Tax=Streptomyces goshikiensis TaxID=1942 RepID=UPI0037D8F1DD
MTFLLSKPKRVVRGFCLEHGDMEGWTDEDFGRLYDLLIVAHAPGMVRRLWLRAKVLAILAYAMPLYALTELMQAVSGCGPRRLRLEQHLDRVDERWILVAEACSMGCGAAFVTRVGGICERITDAICRATGHLAKI